MEHGETITVPITEYIQGLSKELNISKTKGLIGGDKNLIALIKNCEFLYNKSLVDFKNIQKKNEAWEAIAESFGVTVGEVQQRWKNIRDTFSKQRNKSEGEKSICPLYENLLFLEPHIIPRRSRLSLVPNSILGSLTSDDEGHQPQEAGEIDDLRLFIKRVKQKPVLYHTKYNGRAFSKDRILEWDKIAKSFGVDAQECLARWKTIRDRYARERRMGNTGMSSRKWELYDDLSFLDQHIRTRRRYKYINNEDKVCYVLTSGDTIESKFLNELTTKKEDAIEDVEFFDVSSDITSSSVPIFSEEENHLSESTIEPEPNKYDEDDLFGQTIAAELKKLHCPRKKMKLKADIYRVLYESCE